MADGSKARAVSAGTQPGDRVHPEVVAVMKEVSMDLSNAQPQRLSLDLARGASLLVTMGCGDECPVVSGRSKRRLAPAGSEGLPIERVRAIRDEIKSRVERLLEAEGWGLSELATKK